MIFLIGIIDLKFNNLINQHLACFSRFYAIINKLKYN
jgi:hypothetical protein